MLLVFCLNLYVSVWFKLVCPRITRENDQIGFHLKVKGQTLPPGSKEYFRNQKVSRENPVNVFSFTKLCVQGAPVMQRRLETGTGSCCWVFGLQSPQSWAERETKAETPLLAHSPSSDTLEENQRQVPTGAEPCKSCSEPHFSLATLTCAPTPSLQSSPPLALVDIGIGLAALLKKDSPGAQPAPA